MDTVVVDAFLAANRKKLFPNKHYKEAALRTILLNSPDSVVPRLSTLHLQEPSGAVALSVFLGFLGIDRFVAKEYLLGLLKLFTAGGWYVWWIIDAFTSAARCRNRNCKALVAELSVAYTYQNTSKPSAAPAAPVAAPAPAATMPSAAYAAPQTAVQDIPIAADPDVFLSYSHRDKEKLMPLFATLERSGLKIWFDVGIRAGAEWEEEIIEQLNKASSFLFFVTESSLQSANCRDELYQARKRNKKFINVLIEDVDLSKPQFEWFDFRYSRYQQIPAYSMTVEEVVSKLRQGLASQ